MAVPPRKEPASIRLDTDVLDFFLARRCRCQSSIDAVLHSDVKARNDR
ncbi:hypothetical protein [Methylobacterium sp. NEAU K]